MENSKKLFRREPPSRKPGGLGGWAPRPHRLYPWQSRATKRAPARPIAPRALAPLSLELYRAFVLATAVLIVVPGPANALIVAHSIAHGGRRALVTMAGVSAASVVHLALVALGMTTLMVLLSEWFEWLRWAGVAYLVTLGIREWRARPAALDDGAIRTVSGHRLFLRLAGLSVPGGARPGPGGRGARHALPHPALLITARAKIADVAEIEPFIRLSNGLS